MPRQPKPKKGINTPEIAFGQVLRNARKAAGISQELLADKSGYHRTYIGFLERGDRSPSLRAIFNLADTLKVKPSNLIRRVESVHRRAIRPR